jgi:hypothetical protein
LYIKTLIFPKVEATKSINEIDLNQDGNFETKELEYAYIKYYGMSQEE